MFKGGGVCVSCEEEVGSRRVAYRCLKWSGLIILGGRGGFCEGRLYMFIYVLMCNMRVVCVVMYDTHLLSHM